ncbi:MAG: HEAT repeat domain-containing protein [Elusimicrobia bacterium]|nr:HEAT repeat domain-containing protein [Elusimicrobiota bacterium]
MIIGLAFSAAASDFSAEIARLHSRDAQEKSKAIQTLIAAGPKAVAAIVGSSQGTLGREAAARILQKMGPKAIPSLLELLDDEKLRIAAGGFLFQLIGPESLHLTPKLIDCVRKKPGVKHYCGQALVKMMRPTAAAQIERLIAALKDKDQDLRIYAAAALGQIGPNASAAIPALTASLSDSQPAVRASAAGALAKMGAKAKPALPALKQAAAAANPELKRQIEEAIEQING